MILAVRVPTWQLEEDGSVLHVGDVVSSWLTFHEADATQPLAEGAQVIHGAAHALPSWAGGRLGRHPVQIDIPGGTLYWDAPARVDGQVDVAGTVCTNHVDAPEDFPETTGVVRRIQMVWNDFVMGSDRSWRNSGEGPRFEEVSATDFPSVEAQPLDAEAEADLKRQARRAYDRAVSLGEVNPGEAFPVALLAPSTPREVPPGTTETQWTGVLVDLELDGEAAVSVPSGGLLP